MDVEAELARYEKYAERIRPYVVESVSYLNSALRKGQKVLVEGANAAMLDIDFGTYCHPAMSVISLHLISEYINQKMLLIKYEACSKSIRCDFFPQKLMKHRKCAMVGKWKVPSCACVDFFLPAYSVSHVQPACE